MQMSYPFITILFLFCFTLIHTSTSQTTSLLSPITKDDTTGLYSMLVYLKTPLQPSKLHLDLGSYLPIYDCARHYKSSTYQPVIYNSSLCIDIDPKVYSNCFQKPSPGCSNDTCAFFPQNPVTLKLGTGQLLTDKFALPTSQNPGRPGPTSEIVLTCTAPNKYSRIYRGLAKGSTGIASLSRFNYSLSSQISRSTGSPQTFALCLPSSSKTQGVVMFNSTGPYAVSLTYTPLIIGPWGADTDIFFWYKSPDYYIGLTSFKVNGKSVPLNQTLLAISDSARGGTKIGTNKPYAVLQSSIYKALTDAFVEECAKANFTAVKPTEPFRFCYAADKIGMTAAGPNVPSIDLVIGNDGTTWRIYGSNSMVRVGDAWCLGFVDGGVAPRTSVVIGGYQIEDNLLQFDLEQERLGFSSSLLQKGTTCGNFKF